MKKSIYFIFATLLLSSCGGGGGSSNANSNASADTNTNTNETAPIQYEQIEESKVSQTSELTTTEDFLFSNRDSLSVSINIETLRDRRVFLNICHLSDDERLNYQSCLLKSPINAGQLEKELSVGNEVEELGLSIWFYDATAEPLRYTWRRGQGMAWSIES